MSHIYSLFGSVWECVWHKDESPLIKQIIGICNEIVKSCGSVEMAQGCLDSWFNGEWCW